LSAKALPQTSLGELTALPRPPSCIYRERKERVEGKGKEGGSLSFAAGRRKKSRHLMSAGNVDRYIHPAGPPREGEDRKPTAGNVADTDVDEDGVDEVVGSLDARHQIRPMSISCTHTHTIHS